MYLALKKDNNLIPKIVSFLHLNIVKINIISPIRFNDGGLAMFLTLNKNHHKPILGINVSNPLFTIKLRLPVRSYTILAKQNNPEEHKPCPTIKIIHPAKPHHLKITIPQRTNLIWTTDE